MRKTRICFVSPFAFGVTHPEFPLHFGGAEVQLMNYASYCAAQSTYDVFVLCAMPRECSMIHEKGITFVKAYDIEATHTQKSLAKSVSNALSFIRALFSMRADIYIQRNAGCETGIVALCARSTGKRFLYMVSHEIDCDGSFERMNPLRGILYAYGLSHAHKVITQYEGQKELLATKKKITSQVIRTGYVIPPLRDHAREYILWVGRIIDWKRPELFLALAKRMPHERFVMIGPQNCSDEEYAVFLKSLEACPHVLYKARVAFTEIDQFFRSAQLFINTSVHEGFPNTFVQAGRCGVPVITMGVDPDGMFSKKNAGICVHTLEELVTRVSELRTAQKTYHEYAKRIYAYTQEYHDSARTMNDFAHVIRDLEKRG